METEFSRAHEQCRAIAVEIQKGQWRTGLQSIQTLLPVVQAGLAQLPKLAQKRGLKLDEIQINDLPLASLIRSLQAIMGEVNAAIQKHDWTTVADLLEEDLASAVQAVQEVIRELGG